MVDLLKLTQYSIMRERRSGRRSSFVSMVDHIDLEVDRGEAIAIVGESGSGKTLLAKGITRLLPNGFTCRGGIHFKDRDLSVLAESEMSDLRGRAIGMVFQDPFTMLNPMRSCGSHITELLLDPRGKALGRAARRSEAIRRLAEVEITDPGVIERYPFELSGGMRQRVGIAAALARDPELLIADEPTTALDVTTQREILRLLKSIQVGRGMGLVLITHDLRVAFAMCTRVYVLYGGALMETAPALALEREPLHPYSLGLLLSEPPINRRLAVLDAMPGRVPAAAEGASRCQFAPRCSWVTSNCWTQRPAMEAIEPGRMSACLRAGEIRDELASRRRSGTRTDPAEGSRSCGRVLLGVRGATKTFAARGRSGEVRALRGVSIEVFEGEAVGLVGESGSGKTTLARSIVGLERLDGGEVRVGDLVIGLARARPSRESVRCLRKMLQMVFQDPYSSLNPTFTVGTALAEALRLGGRLGHEKEVGELLAQVGLAPGYAGRKPHALSGGERQRVAIARALAVEPSALICDEPLSSLDVSVQAQIMTLFRNLQSQGSISFLFITHDLAVVRQITDRIYVMSQGEVVESGPTKAVLDRPTHPYTRKLIASVPNTEPGWLAPPSTGHSAGASA